MYAEAYVTVHQYDIVLDVTVINRTSETLQNLCLELATMGDLKLVERPQNYTLSPQSSKSIRCSPKTAVDVLTNVGLIMAGFCQCCRTCAPHSQRSTNHQYRLQQVLNPSQKGPVSNLDAFNLRHCALSKSAVETH